MSSHSNAFLCPSWYRKDKIGFLSLCLIKSSLAQGLKGAEWVWVHLTKCRLPLGEQFQVYVLVEMKMQTLPTYERLYVP